ncbi:uncharacterized protein [Haliotis asinina]|uniref:uncharacterized protein n=1 Tax=Haliotis asinina TaxID=109174 RepID=UPI003532019E
MTPLSDILAKYDTAHHSFADDTQLVDSFALNQTQRSLDKTTICTKSIKSWMSSMMLKMNDDKTEAMLVGSKHRLNKITTEKIKIADAEITLPSSVRDLGVFIDQDLTLDAQISHLSRICFFHLKAISNIRQNLTTDAAHTLVRSLVLSRLDYSNSILFGLSPAHLTKLQKIQNVAARIVSLTSKRSHITPVLKSLHWLPIQARIEFKTLSIVFQCLHDLAPQYLSELISVYTPPRQLWSNQQFLLRTPSVHLKNYGRRAFSFAAPSLWNSLPIVIKTATSLHAFKSLLKRHLFMKYYE